MGFALEVVTPERQLLATTADALMLRTTEGEMAVLDGHVSLVAVVVPGLVRVDRPDDEPVRIALHGGFLQVDTGPSGGGGDGASTWETRVTVLAGIAELADEIDVERARAARERAEASRASAPAAEADAASGGPIGAEDPAAVLARADLRLEVAAQASS
jgi:F-type H+-transporting ATPase subunit epsilon